MASIYSWESFIRIHGGEPGARDVFEKTMDNLLRAENPDREVHIVTASQGDGGIDVFVYQEDGIDIYQCKFFMHALNSSRWGQIKESFKKAMEPKGVKVLRWYLCMPREMQKEDIAKWDTFKKEKEKEFTGVELCYIDGSEIISRMEECDRVKNTALMDKYFHENRKKRFTNKDFIIPFTMSKANGAQGGTYVPRDDLLAKIEEIFKTERIVFLSGMGGCGKSELARAYGYKHSDDYDEIFWLTYDDGNKDARVKYNFMELMSKADYKTEQSDIREFSDKVLIIVDNCNREDENFLFELECNTGNAHILISTRLSFIGDFEAIIPVESSEPEKFAYSVFIKNYCKKLRRRSAKEIKDDEIELIYKICEIVQYNTMIVSLLAIKLRDDDRLSISDCAQKIRKGVRTIKGDVKYSKDLKRHSKDMRDILSVLFSDVLRHNFSEKQRAVLTVLCLTPATWFKIDYICALLDGAVEGTSHKGAVEELLDFGWLQGNGDRMTIHPLIAEVISDKPILITEPRFFENLLENYLGLPDEYLKKEEFLIKKILKLAWDVSPDISTAVMILLNDGWYGGSFKEYYPDVKAAYFVYTNYREKRYFEYRNLEKNETCLLAEVKRHGYENEKVVLLTIYNREKFYKLNFNVTFHGMWIHEIPVGFCLMDPFLLECIFNDLITSISGGAFYECSNLIGELKLPDGLISIGPKAFCGCRGLSGELHIPENVTSIGPGSFSSCSGLSGELHIPESVTSIGDNAFSGCSSLSGELHIPESVTSIGTSAFEGCSGLSGELHIPESVTNIGYDAFKGCDRIEKVIFHNPNTVINHFLPRYSDTIIVGYRHSTAESYAWEHDLFFEELVEEV